MNGILVVDKPQGFTSFDVVAKLRGICQEKKIGHSGTLDPMATGVLPVFVGRAVKGVDLQPCQDKEYEAEILFGLSTDTGDVTGAVVAREEVSVTEQAFAAVLPRFVGELDQTPPMYSAVKVGGRPLYSYARAGQEAPRKARRVTVYAAQPLGSTGENRHRLRVRCSKGTYIRTLAEDIGAALGAPATLAALRRTAAGVFTAQQAHTLEDIQAARDQGALHTLLLGADAPFAPLPALELGPGARERLLVGAFVYRVPAAAGLYRAYDASGFVGLVQVDGEATLKAEKILCDRAPLPQ